MSRFFAALCALALTSCITEPMSRDAELGANEGVVLVRVVSNLKFPDWFYVSVRADGETDTHELRLIHSAVRGSYFFGGALPAGHYTPYQMYANFFEGSNQTGTLQVSVTAPIANRTGSFSVAPGRVTNLGTIVYQPGRTIDEKTSEFFVAVDPTPLRTKVLLEGAFPKLAAAVAGKPELGWEKLVAKDNRTKIIEFAKSHAAGLNAITVTPSGAIYGGARMGQVFTSPKLGSPWQRLDTGSLDEITSVAFLPNGGVLAGGEQGFVSYSADRRTWQRVTFAEPDQVVIYLAVAPDRSLVAVSESQNDVVVYTSASPTSGWRELRRFTLPENSFLWGIKNFPTKAGLGFCVYHRQVAAFVGSRLVVLQQPNTIWSYDFSHSAWEENSAPRGAFSLEASRDGYLWIVPLAGAAMFGTGDWGHSWDKRDYFTMDVPPSFVDRNTGYMAARPYGFESTQLMKTSNGGASWTSMGEIKEFNPEKFAIDPGGKNVLAVTRDEGFWVSNDEGKSWHVPK